MSTDNHVGKVVAKSAFSDDLNKASQMSDIKEGLRILCKWVGSPITEIYKTVGYNRKTGKPSKFGFIDDEPWKGEVFFREMYDDNTSRASMCPEIANNSPFYQVFAKLVPLGNAAVIDSCDDSYWVYHEQEKDNGQLLPPKMIIRKLIIL